MVNSKRDAASEQSYLAVIKKLSASQRWDINHDDKLLIEEKVGCVKPTSDA